MSNQYENEKPLGEKAIDWALENTVMRKDKGFLGNAVRGVVKEFTRNWVENCADKPGLDPKEVDNVGKQISSDQSGSWGESAGKLGYRIFRSQAGEYGHYDRAEQENNNS